MQNGACLFSYLIARHTISGDMKDFLTTCLADSLHNTEYFCNFVAVIMKGER